jgi:hypothetical protein
MQMNTFSPDFMARVRAAAKGGTMTADTMTLSDLEPAEIDQAVAELSAAFGWDYGETYAAVHERASGERDPASLALAAAALYRDALDEGQALALAADVNDGEDQDVAASAYNRDGYQDGHYVGSGEIALSYPAEPAGDSWSYDPQAERAGYGGSEVLRLTAAHPSFFTPDDVADAVSLGYEGSATAPYTEDEASRYAALAAGCPAPDLSGPLPSEEDARADAMQDHYARMAGKLKSRGRKAKLTAVDIHDSDRGRPHGKAHHRYCPPGCATDHRAPRHGGDVHPEVARYLDMIHPSGGPGGKERPRGSNVRHSPMSAAELHRARAAARPGHT